MVQASKLYVITHYLFTGTTIHKEYLYEVKLCLNVLKEAQDRRLIKKIIRPRKMLVSVKLKHYHGTI